MAGYVETFRGVVYPWHCDHQGHMSAMHYLGMFDQAFWHLFSMMDFTRERMESDGLGWATVKDTLEYRAEQRVGSLIVIESGLARIGGSSAVSHSVMRNVETGESAATWENVSVLFDTRARGKAAIGAADRERMQGFLIDAPG